MDVKEVLLSLLAIAITWCLIRILDKRQSCAGMARRHFRRHVSANDVANIRYRRLYTQSVNAEIAESEFVAGLAAKQRDRRLRMLENVDDSLMALDDLLDDQAVKDRTTLYLMTGDQLAVVANNHIEWAKLHQDIESTLAMHMVMRQRLAQPQVAASVS